MSQTFTLGLLLYPGFSLKSLSVVVECLETANEVLGSACYRYRVAGPEESVRSASGIAIARDCVECDTVDAWLLIVPGSQILAGSGLLDGYRASQPGDLLELQSSLPEIELSANAWELDRDRMTCSDESGVRDMILALVASHHGEILSTQVLEKIEGQGRGSLRGRGRQSKQPQIEEAVQLMHSNLEEPLGTDELASLVGISRRQLERLFKKHLDTVPSRYYLKLRLEKARKMLREETTPVVQVALACGFSNASHFSTAYRNCFGLSPRDERDQN